MQNPHYHQDTERLERCEAEAAWYLRHAVYRVTPDASALYDLTLAELLEIRANQLSLGRFEGEGGRVMDRAVAYSAYLASREVSEGLLLAYGKGEADHADTFYSDQALNKVRKLAACLGFELKPISPSTQKEDA